jgi:hypothetical protein
MNKIMEEYVERMLNEFKELDERVMKIIAFIDSEKYLTLSLEEQRNLCDQYHAMVLYKSALGKRLIRRGYTDILNKGDKQ